MASWAFDAWLSSRSSRSVCSSSRMKKLIAVIERRPGDEQRDGEQDRAEERACPRAGVPGLTKVATLQVSIAEKAAAATATIRIDADPGVDRLHPDQPPEGRGHEQGDRIAGRGQQGGVDDVEPAHRRWRCRRGCAARNSPPSRPTAGSRRRGSCPRRRAARRSPKGFQLRRLGAGSGAGSAIWTALLLAISTGVSLAAEAARGQWEASADDSMDTRRARARCFQPAGLTWSCFAARQDD